MPWLAVPFTSKKMRDDLRSFYNVTGFPALIILDENGAKKASKTGGGSEALDLFGGIFASRTSTTATSANLASNIGTGSNFLIATDFGIGVKIGADDEVKSLIDRDVEKLVGMKAAKDWCACSSHLIAPLLAAALPSHVHMYAKQVRATQA
jgi:hypothetical protein